MKYSVNYSMKHSLLPVLIFLPLLIAGCGTAAAAQPPVQVNDVVAAAPASNANSDSLPSAPVKAPVFHGVDAKRILPNRIVIQPIKVDTPVVELGWSSRKANSGEIFSEWDVADFAAGWHKNSAVPGEDGNVVLSGHNNIKGSVFRELDQLKRGDPISVWVGDNEHKYAVDEVLILPEKYATAKQRKSNVRYIEPTKDDRLTLVSCWPRDDNTHRIVVIARPAKEE